MNRLTRITAILTHLQSKKIITAKEIANRFEISLRTVYRDIKTLQDAGVPIGSENGLGYFIVDGYSLPPIMITEEEANALVISEKFILNQGDSSLKQDFNSLLIKIKATLKNYNKDHLSKLNNRITPSVKKENYKSNSLAVIQKSITRSVVLKIRYHSIYKDEITERLIEPLGIYFTDKAWVVVANCNLRNQVREFRLDRIIKVNETSQSFTHQKDFNLSKYFLELLEHS